MVRNKLKSSYSPEDFLRHASVSADEMDEVLNVMFEHLHDWYSMYLPELEDCEDRKVYLEVVEKYNKGDKGSAGRLSERAKEILPKGDSIGLDDIEDEDLKMLQEFGGRLKQLYELREMLNEYREGKVQNVAKNVTHVVGPALATKLIVGAGSVKKLANMPASTIQVLGAEKALFMHLTRKTRPPKHGVIFLHPLMRGVPKVKRGKVARLIAAKISLAAKADAYSGKFIAEGLKSELERKIAALRDK